MATGLRAVITMRFNSHLLASVYAFLLLNGFEARYINANENYCTFVCSNEFVHKLRVEFGVDIVKVKNISQYTCIVWIYA